MNEHNGSQTRADPVMKKIFIGLEKLFFLGSDIRIFIGEHREIQLVESLVIIWGAENRRKAI